MKTFWRFWFYYKMLRAASDNDVLGPHSIIRAAVKAAHGAVTGRIYLSPKRLFYP